MALPPVDSFALQPTTPFSPYCATLAPFGLSLKRRLAGHIVGVYPCLRWTRIVAVFGCLAFLVAGALSTRIYEDAKRERGSTWGMVAAYLGAEKLSGSIDWDSNRQLFCHYVSAIEDPNIKNNPFYSVYPPGGPVDIRGLCEFLSRMESHGYWTSYGISGSGLLHFCLIVFVTFLLKSLPQQSLQLRKRLALCVIVTIPSTVLPLALFLFWEGELLEIIATGIHVVHGIGWIFLVGGVIIGVYCFFTLLVELLLVLFIFDFDLEDLNVLQVDSLLTKARCGGLPRNAGGTTARCNGAPSLPSSLFSANYYGAPVDSIYPSSLSSSVNASAIPSPTRPALHHLVLMSPGEAVRLTQVPEAPVVALPPFTTTPSKQSNSLSSLEVAS